MWVMGEAMTKHPSLINLAEIPSNPVAFLVLSVLINFYTVLSVTVEKSRSHLDGERLGRSAYSNGYNFS